MDALNFFRIKRKMCREYVDTCTDCPLSGANNRYSIACSEFEIKYPEDAIQIVSDWEKEHPLITNRIKFKEVFGITLTEALEQGTNNWLNQEYEKIYSSRAVKSEKEE